MTTNRTDTKQLAPPSDALNPLATLGFGDPGALILVSGWRNMGWIRYHLRGQGSVVYVQLGACRTVADAIFVLGHGLNCEIPGSSSSVAEALGKLGHAHLVLDARYSSPELVVALHGTVSLMASQLVCWATVGEPVDLGNHIACPEPFPSTEGPLRTGVDVAAWLPGTHRSSVTIPADLCLPDSEKPLLRADLAAVLRREPNRSISAVADSVIHGHVDLFVLATGVPRERVSPMDLFGLRFIAEAATDANVACLSAAAAARTRLRIGQASEALERIDQAMSRSQYADPVHRALLIWAEAIVQKEIGEEAAALARFEEAATIVHNQRDLGFLATLHRQWAELFAERGQAETAAEHFRLARGLYRRQGNTEGLSASLRGAADLAVMGNETISAEALYDQAEMTTTTDVEQANRLLGQVGLLISVDDWVRAETLLERVERIGLEHSLIAANLHRRRADLAMRKEDHFSAIEEAGLARSLYERAGKKASAARCLRLMADAHALCGEEGVAIKLYRQAAHDQIRTGDWIGMHRTISHASQICNGEIAARLGRLSTELMTFRSAR